MSVDYESVLIYGYKITKSEIKRLEEDTGKFIEEFCDKYDGTDSIHLLQMTHMVITVITILVSPLVEKLILTQ